MKRANWFWGIFFIVCAVLLITNQLGFLGGITPLNIVLTLFLLAMLIQSLIRLEAFGISFSLAFLVIIYSDYLGLQNVSFWIILLAALFAGTGLSMLLKPRVKHRMEHLHYGRTLETVEDLNDNYVRCKTSLGSDIKYLRSANLEQASLECSMGSLKVFFDQAQISPDGAVIQVKVSLGSLELYIPRSWKIANNVTASLGSVETHGVTNEADGPQVTLSGEVSLGSVEIHYI